MVYVKREKERASGKMEGKNRWRGAGRRDQEKETGMGEYSLLYSVENIILFKLRLSSEVSGWNAPLSYLGIFCF